MDACNKLGCKEDKGTVYMQADAFFQNLRQASVNRIISTQNLCLHLHLHLHLQADISHYAYTLTRSAKPNTEAGKKMR